MDRNKTQIAGTGIALFVGFVFLIIVTLNIPNVVGYLFHFKMEVEKLDLAQLTVSVVGFAGAIVAFGFAYVQYRTSEKWKRIEFIANEIKEFEADPVVQNALMMIDWGRRKINLHLVSEPTPEDFKIITRTVQWKALLPHEVKHKYAEYQSKPEDESAKADAEFAKFEEKKEDADETNGQSQKLFNFAVDEAKIRDTYDVFLTRLDRFQTFIKAKLIDADELYPFIEYWIDSLTNTDSLLKDAAWRFTLLTYINRYKYTGVIELFKHYGLEIDIEGKDYKAIKEKVQNKTLAERLCKSVKSRKQS